MFYKKIIVSLHAFTLVLNRVFLYRHSILWYINFISIGPDVSKKNVHIVWVMLYFG